MSQNNGLGSRISIYSNGLACVTRGVEVAKEGTTVEIPCKHDHLGDVLASLVVNGLVAELEPATFRPDDTAGGLLDIDPANPFVSTFRKVSGVKANVTLAGGKKIDGAVIYGIEEEKVVSGNAVCPAYQLVFSENGMVRRVNAASVEGVEVTDPIAKAEIDRALRRNLRKIKPGSTFVSMKLAAEKAEKAQASLTYVVPVPANSYTYRLVQGKGGESKLAGFAIVHNDTEDDWNSVLMEVVIGNPLTCKNNLAMRIHPTRSERSFVQSKTQAGFAVAGGLGDLTAGFLMNDAEDEGGELESVGGGRRSMKSARARGGPEAMMSYGLACAGAAPPPPARRAGAKMVEVDDFAMFSCDNPISIGSNSSGLVPIIDLPLKTKPVLIFDAREHKSLAFRAAEFDNTSAQTLPFGAVTFYTTEGTNFNSLLGETLTLPQLKPGDKARVPYAVDSSLRAKVESTGVQQKIGGFRIAEGVVVYTYATECVTTYTFYNQNGKDIADLLVEHVSTIEGSKPEAQAESAERTEFGYRFTVKSPAKGQTVVLKVVERGTDSQQIAFDNHWIHSNLIRQDGNLGDLLKVASVQRAVQITQQIVEKDQEVADANLRVQNAEREQVRAREALGALKQGGDQGNWNKYLNEAEETIRQLQRETLPRLTKERQALQRQQIEAMVAVRAEWVAPK